MLALPAVVVYVLLSRFRPGWLARGADAWAAAKAKLAGAHRHLPWAPDLSGYMLVLALLYVHLDVMVGTIR